MPQLHQLDAATGDILLLVGTMKGAFVLRSSASRSQWDVAGPYFPGRAIYAMAYDNRRGRQRLWAAVNSPHLGLVSEFVGRLWPDVDRAGGVRGQVSRWTPTSSLKQIWQIAPGAADQPDTLYCGVEPAALFRVGRCGCELVAGARTVRPSASPQVDAGRRRLVPAHHPARSRRSEAPACRDFVRRPLPHR